MMKAISVLSIGALAAFMASCLNTEHSASATGERYSWKKNIVTTVFWIGERPSGNNPVPNRRSSWDKDWTRNYGGFDDPNPAHRSNYIPVKFTPRQNPFYCALPYNDKSINGHRPEAPRVVQGSLPRPRRFHLQGSMGRDSQRESNGLCAMGRRRTFPHRSLAICFWQRTSEAQSEQRRGSRCLSRCA